MKKNILEQMVLEEFNKFPIIPSFFYKLAVALSNSKKVKKVLIGKDTRESCKL